ncbi:hypothetical protein Ciccas_005240 [Cichlidogyrus casuarinus]|uniref:Neuroendocrine protein 7B2 n=1 Tax=Cichlidogyrus casuarinus TaxID=1844966 RepID=A0ABD2QA53_9PLAT
MIVVLLLGLVVAVNARNYEEFLANSLAHNMALRDDYLSKEPKARHLMDQLARHPLLQDSDEYSPSDESEWNRLVRYLNNDEQMNENEPIMVTQREKVEPRSQETVFQNHLNGKHQIVGGSSEVGEWLDYALQGAGAQDDDESLPSGLGKEDVKEDKLPTYCNPPNPCPIGYDQNSLTSPCDDHIENNREFQEEWNRRQMENGECACDTEHMKRCPREIVARESVTGSPFMRGQKRTRLVAKKSSHRINKRSHSSPVSARPISRVIAPLTACHSQNFLLFRT